MSLLLLFQPSSAEVVQPPQQGGGSTGWSYSPPLVRGSLSLAISLGMAATGTARPVPITGSALVQFRLAIESNAIARPVDIAGSGQIVMQIQATALGRVDNSLPDQIAEEDQLLLLLIE